MLLLIAAVLGQKINMPTNTMVAGQGKCSIVQNITVTNGTANPITLNITYPSDFTGFVVLDGVTSNSTTFTTSKTWANISICSYNTTTNKTYSPFTGVLTGLDTSNYTFLPS